MERGHHPAVARGEAEWEVTDPGQAPAAVVFAPAVEKKCLTSRETRAII